MNKNFNNIKVGVLAGGVFGEREVSLVSGQEAFNALSRKKIKTVLIDVTSTDPKKVKTLIESHNIDAAFIALHGQFGEDGQIQAILEDLNIIFTGSGKAASYLAMDKIKSKEIFIKHNVPTPNFKVLTDKAQKPQNMQYPIVVKPYFGGSSIGITILDKPSGLDAALDEAFLLGDKVILEEYIEGRELTVGVLGDSFLPVVEIVPKEGYYDYNNKYSDGLVDFIVPASLDKNLSSKTQEAALLAHKVLGCRDFSRTDIRLSKEGVIFVLEVNSIPGLTTHSLLPMAAKSCGIEFDDLILKMLQLAIERRAPNG